MEKTKNEEREGFFKRKVNIFGKSVSVMVLTLLVLGTVGVTAALLTYFGSIRGSTTVGQAIKLDGNNWDQPLLYTWDSQNVLGREYVEKHYMESFVDTDVGIQFKTHCWNTQSNDTDSPSVLNDIDWTDECDGILTRYVEYFDDAGVDIGTYTYDGSDCDVDITSGTLSDLQAAVDDVNNDVVCFSGTYSGQLTVARDITLKGHDGATLKAVDSMTTHNINGEDRRPVLYVGSSDVTIENVVIDGLGKGNTNNEIIGIAYHNTGGLVNFCEIKNVMNTPHSGAQYGVGLYAFNDGTETRTLSVTNNHIHDYQKNGMVIKGYDDSDIYNNLVEGVGTTGVTAQNGIQVQTTETGDTATVRYNTVTGNDYNCNKPTCDGDESNGNEDNWEASGILLYGTVTANKNHVHDNGYNIAVGSGNVDISECNIFDGDPYYSDVASWSPNTVADNNWWGTDGIDIAATETGEDYSSASWMTKTDMNLESGTIDYFGIINNFDVLLQPDTYTMEMQVLPV